MGFLTSLFGGAENTILTVAVALGIVLVLIVLGVWALKLVFKASSNVGRIRQRRLAVVDSAAIDTRRQLVLVRRDNVEHLILIGGGQELVVETGIPVPPAPAIRPRRPAAAPAEQARREPPDASPRRRLTRSLMRRGDADAPPAPPRADELPASPLDRLHELGRPAGERQSPSLRHTGLLRPVSRMEPPAFAQPPDNGGPNRPDSAKNGSQAVAAADDQHAVERGTGPGDGAEAGEGHEAERGEDSRVGSA